MRGGGRGDDLPMAALIRAGAAQQAFLFQVGQILLRCPRADIEPLGKRSGRRGGVFQDEFQYPALVFSELYTELCTELYTELCTDLFSDLFSQPPPGSRRGRSAMEGHLVGLEDVLLDRQVALRVILAQGRFYRSGELGGRF